MNYTGISLVDKSKISKVLSAIERQELDSLYGALRNSDEALRKDFAIFLCNNPLPRADVALRVLTTTSDPFTAVRAASMCLLAGRAMKEENS